MHLTGDSHEAEREARDWLAVQTKSELPTSTPLQDLLRDGTLLCRALNAAFPDHIRVPYTAATTMPFRQMENIAAFNSACSQLPGFRSFDTFGTVDLWEGKGMAQVVRCVLACKRLALKLGHDSQGQSQPRNHVEEDQMHPTEPAIDDKRADDPFHEEDSGDCLPSASNNDSESAAGSNEPVVIEHDMIDSDSECDQASSHTDEPEVIENDSLEDEPEVIEAESLDNVCASADSCSDESSVAEDSSLDMEPQPEVELVESQSEEESDSAHCTSDLGAFTVEIN